MSNSPTSYSFEDALSRAKRVEHLLFWLFASVWVLGALAVLVYSRYLQTTVKDSSAKVDEVHAKAEKLKKEVEFLDDKVKLASASASGATRELDRVPSQIRDVRSSVQQFSRSQREQQEQTDQSVLTLRNDLTQLQGEFNRLKADADQIHEALPGMQLQIKQLLEQVSALSALSRSTTASLKQAEKKLALLEDAAQKAQEKFRPIERELQTAHYVFTPHSQYKVWGNDIFIRFGKWRRSEAGLEDFCVSATENGPCLYGPKFLPLGEQIEVVRDRFKYRITARYVVGMLLAHDQVGIDVDRELIKPSIP